jgi:23S rRNA pseudouridine1911/1915/1917 synthase
VAGRPRATTGEGGAGGGALSVTFCVVVRTERLDRFLADQLALSRTQAGRLIADKRVRAGGKPLRASALLERGAEVTVEFPDAEPPRSYTPAHAVLNFVYEDEHLAVLDKPAGLVVHPGPGHWDDTLVNVLVGRGTDLSGGASAEAGRPGIVHRLDRDTSGLLVVAKSDLAHRRLAGAIERRQVKRVYAALVWGHLRKNSVDIEAPIARNPKDRKRMTVAEGGRHAVTHAALVARFAHADLLRVRLGTGRTHQIRVHLAHIGCPIVGDREYTFGGSRRVTPSARVEAERLEALAPRQLLHAAALSFAHPVSGAPLHLTSEWPADLRPALADAAADQNLLAQPNPLQYLGFFASDE